MPSHNRTKRTRNQSNKGQEDDRLLATRAAADDSSYGESYSRRQSDNYRPSHRNHYEIERDASSSRNHSSSWRSADPHDRYEYPDPYFRAGREDFDMVDSRDAEGWSGHGGGSGRYEQPAEEWSRRYDTSFPSSSYGEPTNWRPPSSYEDRPASYSAWSPDNRGYPRNMPEENHDDGWRRDDRKQGGAQKWKSDNGWESRRESRSSWNDLKYSDPPSTAEDRTWEPAPGWQPSGSHDSQHADPEQSHTSASTQHNKNGHRNQRSKGKKGKRTQDQSQNQKRDRDWRNDDGDFNNWQRRDFSDTQNTNKTKSNRKRYPRSPSRSRSRSPPGTYTYSPRPHSRSRSRSPSPIVKRRRKDRSPIFQSPPSHPPSERGRPSRKQQHWTRENSRSTSHQRLEKRNVSRRSISTASSRTRSSRSPSPVEQPKAVHRLPQASTVSVSSFLVRDSPKKSKGKNKTNGKSKKKNANDNSFGKVVHPPSHLEDMPPPSSLPLAYNPPSHLDTSEPPLMIMPEQQRPPSPVTSKPRNAGFKPIGQTSSALKRFFPADDDDEVPPQRAQPQISHWIPEPSIQQPLKKDPPVVEPTTRGLVPRQTFPLPPRPPSPQQISHEPSPTPTPSHHTAIEEEKMAEEDQETLPPHSEPQEMADDTTTADPNPPRQSAPSKSKDLYAILSQVGEGTFGKVYKAQNRVTKVYVALKRIRMETEKDGFPVTAMREIKLLQSLKHDNVVRLYEMMVSSGSVYMVFEYMDHDLTGVLSQTQFSFTDAHLKSLCHQMLSGLAYLHHKGVIHRDIKGSNILLNNKGELKLADFGLARFYHKRRRVDYTNRVITLWYRPPELLFGATVYGPEVDMWSAGCIMLELFTKKPVFQGNDEIHQLDVIYRIFGTPDPDRWRGVMDLPWFELVKPREPVANRFRDLFRKWMSPAALDLAERLLAYDPSQRMTATQAMEAPYFTQEQPNAVLPTGLATLEGEWHELETKKERARKRRKTEATL